MPNNPTTELRIIIHEDSLGGIEVNWQMLVKDTDIQINPRISHVLGQLQAAGHIIAAQNYTKVSNTNHDGSNSTSKGKTGGKDKKISAPA